MEASAAGLAAGDAPAGDAQQGGAATGTESQEQAQPTLADVQGSLEQLSQIAEQQREFLAGEPWKAADDGEQTQEQQTPAEMDFGFLDDTQPGYDPQAAVSQLGDLIRGEAQRIAQEQVAPLKQELAQKDQDRAFEDLAQRYPQLEDEKVGQEVLDTAAKWVEAQGLPSDLATHPGIVEIVYLGARARQQNQQGGDGAAAATLEGAGGASPGGAGQGASPQTAADWANQVAPKRLGLFAGSGR